MRRKVGEAGELEARETGDEHARDHGKGKGERRNVSLPFAFPFSLARPPVSQREGGVWEQGRALGVLQLRIWVYNLESLYLGRRSINRVEISSGKNLLYD